MSHEYRMEQLRAAIAAARKNFKKDANFFVVGLTYGCRRSCMLEHSERMVFMMAMLWAQQIMLGKKTFADVPRLLKDKVKEILMDSGMEELVTL